LKYFSRSGQKRPDDTDSLQFRELILGAIVAEVLSSKSEDYSNNLYKIDDIFDLTENKESQEFDEEGFKAEAKKVIKEIMDEPLGSILPNLTFQKEYSEFKNLTLAEITDRERVKELLKTKRGERPPVMEPSEDFISLAYIKKTLVRVEGEDRTKNDKGKVTREKYIEYIWEEAKAPKEDEYHPESKLGWLKRHPEYSPYLTPSESSSPEVTIGVGAIKNKSDKEKLFDRINALKEEEGSSEFNQMVDEIVAYEPKEEETSKNIEEDDSLVDDEKEAFKLKIHEKYPDEYQKLYDRNYFYKGKQLFEHLYNTSPLEEDEISEERSGDPELVKEAHEDPFSYIRRIWPTEWNLYIIKLKLYDSKKKFSIKVDKTHELFQTGLRRGTGAGDAFRTAGSRRLLPIGQEYDIKYLRNFIEEVVEEYRDLKELLG